LVVVEEVGLVMAMAKVMEEVEESNPLEAD
jgi:hypothetical protein